MRRRVEDLVPDVLRAVVTRFANQTCKFYEVLRDMSDIRHVVRCHVSSHTS